MDPQNVPPGEEALACLAQAALKARVSEQEPSPRVWKRIRLELETDTSTSRRYDRPCLAEGHSALT
jgi:hypothetical protein